MAWRRWLRAELRGDWYERERLERVARAARGEEARQVKGSVPLWQAALIWLAAIGLVLFTPLGDALAGWARHVLWLIFHPPVH